MKNKMRLKMRLLGSLVLSMACMDPAMPDSRATQSWVGTWGASAAAPVPAAEGFGNQTLRLIVHTSIGGDQLRLHFSNTFGSKPLVIGAASIGLPAMGAELIPGSIRPVTFDGRASVTVPPGALIVSDALSMNVPPQQHLAVSIFIASDSGPATAHPLALETSYVSGAGDFCASTEGAPFRTPIQTWPFLSQIEVRAKPETRAVVTFGDSITDGLKSTPDADRRWPDRLEARFAGARRDLAVVNEAISGNRMWNDATAARSIFGPNGLSRFARDALDVVGVSHIVVLLGINDIGLGAVSSSPEDDVSAEKLIMGMKQFAIRAHARGIKLIGATLTPFGGAMYFSAKGEEKRLAVNAWIRSAKELDGVIDFDAAVRNPGQVSQFRSSYDSGDHLHPGDAGYQAMADSIALSLFD